MERQAQAADRASPRARRDYRFRALANTWTRLSRLLSLLLLLPLVSCGDSTRPLAVKVVDEEGTGVAGVEIRQVGLEVPLGRTESGGIARIEVKGKRGESVRLRLTFPEGSDGPLYIAADPEGIVTVSDQALQDRVLRVQVRRQSGDGAAGDSLAVLNLTTTPPGATALVADEPRGITPVSIPGLPIGRVSIEVRLAGYHPWSREVYLEPGANDYPVELQAETVTTASLTVDSDPAGATIFLDDNPTGRTTPASLDGLAAGAHRVRLTKSGHEPYHTRVTVSPGTPGVIRGYLAPAGESRAGGADARPPAGHGVEGRGAGERPGGVAPDGSEARTYTITTRPWCSVYVDGNETVDRNAANIFTITLHPGPHRFHLVNTKAGIDVNLVYEVRSDDPATSLILDAEAARVIPRRK